LSEKLCPSVIQKHNLLDYVVLSVHSFLELTSFFRLHIVQCVYYPIVKVQAKTASAVCVKFFSFDCYLSKFKNSGLCSYRFSITKLRRNAGYNIFFKIPCGLTSCSTCTGGFLADIPYNIPSILNVNTFKKNIVTINLQIFIKHLY
jgi:hypothetical protein